ncbi:hypothetical protein FNV43_RR02795 [Rhamnella rubrinervis]|uniref:Pentatricopeptide repeat-containing protein n=1 Tax=Rhamnella rubrinervis TaxID=2594499 RepID=A0A8K0MNA3_9ROSA|nr:hypothetical protein FNV43_RR02795 [Rhamnella rubrinervis]
MLSLKLKNLAKTRANYYIPQSQLVVFLNYEVGIFASSSSSSSSAYNFYSSSSSSLRTPWVPRSTTTTSDVNKLIQQKNDDVLVQLFKGWFKRNNNALLDRIFKILRSTQSHVDVSPGLSVDLALSQLDLRLSETFVLEVLRYGYHREDVLSCLKFFDWAGRQPGFHHTRATFSYIFKILSRAKLMSLILDFLGNYIKQNYAHKVRFHDTLVMGYAVAGKPEIALQLFGKMRFQGLDLDSFAYHVLLNALVEEKYFDAVQVIFKQISIRGFENDITYSVMMKSFCKQEKLDEAESYLRELAANKRPLSGHVLSVLVDALCKNKKFERASSLIEEFRDSHMVLIEHAYGVLIRDLVKAGKLDGALEFFKNKKSLDGYVPDVFRYNILICRLLRENRLMEVCDLLTEMNEGQISPDEVTMNAALCLFCKAGMVDVALNLYNARSEFGLTPNSMAYNYLINTLCGDGSIDEAYWVLKNCIDQGFLLGRRTFSILADALCRQGNLDKMKELVDVAFERNYLLNDSVLNKYISALCRARKVELGYLVHGELNRRNIVTNQNAYFRLINSFSESNRWDIAAKLLIEMQEKGHKPTRNLFRAVIGSICKMENPEKQFHKLLEMQLSYHEPNCLIYNFFIDGAGHAKRPDLAREVFEMMLRTGIKPSLSSDILMLQGYLKSERVSDALKFFNGLHERRKVGRKLYNILVVGLCKAEKVNTALEVTRQMKENDVVPSIECYEALIQKLFEYQRYSTAVNLINDFEKTGRKLTSFIGNVLLLHSLKTPELYDAWFGLREELEGEDEISGSSMLGLLIGVFCGRVRVSENVVNLEEVIEKCFPPDVYTYNMLLRRLCISRIDDAHGLFDRMRSKGYEPNGWTYDILVRGCISHGRKREAKEWLDEMYREGFEPTDTTKQLI